MSIALAVSESPAYAIAPRALRRWASERLRCDRRADGGSTCSFTLSGSTCNNRPLDVIMTVALGADGRIECVTARPAPGDSGCDAMCSANCNGRRFLAESGNCAEAIGLTLQEAAFLNWDVEPSGCFCTPGNRRHKWRNVFQTLCFAAAHAAATDTAA